MIGTILAVASLAANAFGAKKSAQANKAIERQIANRESELETWYNKEYNQSYLDSAESKSAVTILRNQIREQMKKVDQNNAITGASDERRVATADKANQHYQDLISKLAGYGTRYKDSLRREYMYGKTGIENLELANLQGKSQNWSNLMSNASNVAGGAAEAEAGGAFKKWDDSILNWFSRLGRNNKRTFAPDI